MADTRQVFQGNCFLYSVGHKWMKDNYDPMPPSIRKRLMDSPFNICAACVGNPGHSEEYYNRVIDRLESEILKKLGPFGPQPVNPAPLVAKPRKRRR